MSRRATVARCARWEHLLNPKEVLHREAATAALKLVAAVQASEIRMSRKTIVAMLGLAYEAGYRAAQKDGHR